MSQGMWATFRSYKRQRMGSLELPKGILLCSHLGFSPVRSILDFLPPELVENVFVLF
jgi:hypothetical protein